jgi:uncharacterized membrane protein
MTGSRLRPAQFGLAYGVVLVVVVALDAIWLGVFARDLYKREMGSLMSDTVRVLPVALFYLLYPLALVYLALFSAPAGWSEALLRSAALGLAAYGAYDLTNIAIVRGWSVRLALGRHRRDARRRRRLSGDLGSKPGRGFLGCPCHGPHRPP